MKRMHCLMPNHPPPLRLKSIEHIYLHNTISRFIIIILCKFAKNKKLREFNRRSLHYTIKAKLSVFMCLPVMVNQQLAINKHPGWIHTSRNTMYIQNNGSKFRIYMQEICCIDDVFCWLHPQHSVNTLDIFCTRPPTLLFCISFLLIMFSSLIFEFVLYCIFVLFYQS